MTKTTFEWAVVGAGPAGIAAVGKLLDQGVKPESLLWLDPQFKVGDLGSLWTNVSSNTTVQRFIDYLQDAASFNYQQVSQQFSLSRLAPHDTCTLSHIVEPLQWVSDQLRQQITSIATSIHSMSLTQRVWSLLSNNNHFQAKNVVLATGAVPASLNYAGIDILPFETAIDKNKLAEVINQEQVYGVFGSSHSAIIIIRHLVELGVKKIINFYRSPCRYAVEMGNWILFDNTGLKGQTAEWAREYIDGVMPANLERYIVSEQHIARYLPQCDQVIYAVGFEKRNNLLIGDYEQAQYNPHVGIIGPGLFGLGIAFPEKKSDPFGTVEAQVGLWKFMVYLNRVMPVWLKYPC